MARTKAPDAPPSRAQVRKGNLKALAEAYAETSEGGDTFAAEQIRTGLRLDEEKIAHQELIAANRLLLRTLATSGIIAQADVDMLYAPKGSTDDDTEASA